MTGRRPFRLGLVLLAVVLATAACRTAPVHNVVAPLAPAPGTRLSMDDVAQAIWRAGNRLGWQIETVSPGALRGTLKLRQHVAVVAIAHDTSTVRITYQDSTNLKYDGQEIHRRYNQWVQNLERGIQMELAGAGKK
jgi:hypothetical protein